MSDQVSTDEGRPDGSDPVYGWFDFTRKQWVSLVVALMFFAGAIGFAVGEYLRRPPGADSVDVGFLRDMISHHEQAQTMARLDDAYGAEIDVQVFAREILLFQSYEVGLMERQLAHWGYDRADRPETAMRWMGTPVPVAEMPGLASNAEMERLQRLQRSRHRRALRSADAGPSPRRRPYGGVRSEGGGRSVRPKARRADGSQSTDRDRRARGCAGARSSSEEARGIRAGRRPQRVRAPRVSAADSSIPVRSHAFSALRNGFDKPFLDAKSVWAWQESNLRPPGCDPGALAAAPHAQGASVPARVPFHGAIQVAPSLAEYLM